MSCNIELEVFPSKYKFFGCFHVRLGTSILAVLQIIIHFVVIACTIIIISHSFTHEKLEYISYSFGVMSFIQWEKFTTSFDKVFMSNVTTFNTSFRLKNSWFYLCDVYYLQS